MYNSITKTRNLFYDVGVFKSSTSPIITLCVGNLRVGGTGKSPFVEYLLRFLVHKQIQTGTLSRGYGRNTRGFIHASSSSSSSDIGDESLQYFKKFSPNINVFVGEKRVDAMKKIKSNFNGTKVVILDDAFQHRALKANYNILLSEYSRPFFNDYLLPYGRLREARNGARRADCIIITKCPESISEAEMALVEDKTRKYVSNFVPIFFTRIDYGRPQELFFQNKAEMETTNVVLLSGIDNPIPFFDHCRKQYNVLDEIIFPDHHSFSENEVVAIARRTKRETDCVLITTEKDTSRLITFEKILAGVPVFYIPIEVTFVKDEKLFLDLVERWTSV